MRRKFEFCGGSIVLGPLSVNRDHDPPPPLLHGVINMSRSQLQSKTARKGAIARSSFYNESIVSSRLSQKKLCPTDGNGIERVIQPKNFYNFFDFNFLFDLDSVKPISISPYRLGKVFLHQNQTDFDYCLVFKQCGVRLSRTKKLCQVNKVFYLKCVQKKKTEHVFSFCSSRCPH